MEDWWSEALGTKAMDKDIKAGPDCTYLPGRCHCMAAKSALGLLCQFTLHKVTADSPRQILTAKDVMGDKLTDYESNNKPEGHNAALMSFGFKANDTLVVLDMQNDLILEKGALKVRSFA